MIEDLVEIERSTWQSFLYPDGSMKRGSDSSRVISHKHKVRTTGYKRDRILGPAANSSRVKELQQMISSVSKEDLQ